MAKTFLVALTDDAPSTELGVPLVAFTTPSGTTHQTLRCSAVEWLPASFVRLELALEEKSRVQAVLLHQHHIRAILEGKDLPKSFGFGPVAPATPSASS